MGLACPAYQQGGRAHGNEKLFGLTLLIKVGIRIIIFVSPSEANCEFRNKGWIRTSRSFTSSVIF